MISFHQLIREGGKDGARESFERLIAQLVGLQYPGVKRVEAHPGDWGLDVIVGEIDDVLSVWQAKFFIDGVGDAQKAQIREAFSQVMANATEHGFTVDVWALCIPVDLDPGALTWWTNWKRGKRQEHSVRIELMARTDLEGLLIAPDAAGIRAAFFPTVTPSAAPPAPVHEVPEDLSYDDMLFIKQLQAARITELESAKQQFFNAEALAREVADKRVTEHMHALQAETADLLSIWEDRYNSACDAPRRVGGSASQPPSRRDGSYRAPAQQRAHRGAPDAPRTPQGRHASGRRERTSRLDPRLPRRRRGPPCLNPS